ncbi:ABC transporter permease [Jiangella anatolica]|uniref:Peptide ABC transporter permease n=1 Tax=Jiangella anatolica TaxID=2670374 RepID=A0A2W2BLN7_9ACTN|nr:ABC transporter permease [Jiangella anatolica]PZF86270.1 peptide ABC transporter permease [Jiangella anatolica]
MPFLLRRLAFYAVTAWAALTINFVIPRLMPGDPVQALIARFQATGQVSPEQTESLRILFGLDQDVSLWTQYWQYWAQVLGGDLGLSFTYFPTPVSEVIRQTLPWTLILVGLATLISFVIGTSAGMVAGWRRGSLIDGLLPLATFFAAVPYFWLGLIAIALFAVTFPVFPTSGGYDVGLTPGWSADFVGSAVYHGMLPALTIVVSSLAPWILGMRNMMVTVASEDYVTVAHAKGLPARRVMMSYAARNAILPSVSTLALSLGFVVGGSLVTEMVFNYPGIGLALFQSINAQDYPLMQAIFLILTLAVLAANLVADVAFVLLDPRIRRAT